MEAGLRFAFYGRVSTKDYQDPVSSRRWQLDVATELVAGRGRIVAQFFDVGYTRELSWSDRPQAAALLAAVANPDRGFDAIVVGEYARAFSGGQIRHVAMLLQQHGVQLWLPETDGPIDVKECPAIRRIAPMLDAGSRLASTANRVARSRNSSGYFRGAAMTVNPPGVRCLHQTRGGTELVRFLRANQITIICNRDGVCLETETAGVTINRDTRSTPTTTERIPRQRSSTTRAPRGNR